MVYFPIGLIFILCTLGLDVTKLASFFNSNSSMKHCPDTPGNIVVTRFCLSSACKSTSPAFVYPTEKWLTIVLKARFQLTNIHVLNMKSRSSFLVN